MKVPLPLALCGALFASLAVSPGVEFTLLDEGASCDYLVPSVANGGSTLGLSWIEDAEPANFASWTKGATTGIGYERSGGYDPHIATDVEAQMYNQRSTIYLRIPFQIADAGQLANMTSLSLNMKSDDGFIAYLNGVRVDSGNPPTTAPDWDSQASTTTNDATAVQFVPVDVSQFAGLLRVGENLLALHGLNAGNGSSDFLISPQLVASDAVPPPPPPELRLVEVASGLSRPVDVQNAGDGSGRLFVVEKPGRVRIITPEGGLLPTPFLNITALVDDRDNEEGLLGIAFPPDFATKQHFYLNYTTSTSDTVISRFSVSANPNVADAGSEEIVLRVGQPFGNHNGGQVEFGPDGFLYISFGDGGSGNDPGDRAQNPATLLGKMVRIDVEGPPDTGLGYAIPPSNPFVGDATTRDEIWALGLRNPYRFSFDRATGDMYIGDVGQNAFEEVDFEPAGDPGGRNYGWRWWEGNLTRVISGREPQAPVFPVHEYALSGGNCSVIAGTVYRASRFPRMHGIFFFADYCRGDLRSLSRDASGEWQAQSLLPTGLNPTGFGEDEAGDLHLVSDGGSVFRLEDSQDANYLQNISSGETPDGRPMFEVGVAIGRSYQLQISADLQTWVDVGTPVAADDFSLAFELPAENFSPPRQFLRVAELN